MLPGNGSRIKWRGNHANIGQEWCQAFWTLLLYDYSTLLGWQCTPEGLRKGQSVTSGERFVAWYNR